MSSNQPITKKRVGAILLARGDQGVLSQTVLLSLGNTHPAIRKAPQTEAAPQGVPECHQEGGLPTAASPNRFLRRLECSRCRACSEKGVKTSPQPSSGWRLLRKIRTSCAGKASTDVTHPAQTSGRPESRMRTRSPVCTAAPALRSS